MTDNLYASPRSDLSAGDQHKRPIPVYLIAALCTFQVAALIYLVSSGWRQIDLAISAGALSPVAFLAKFLFPLFHFISGMLLFFMRKAGAYAFGAYLAWSAIRLFTDAHTLTTLADFTLTVVITVYSAWLYRRGSLK
ncbi:hypothetical protein [Pseudoduganella sp. R-34]|uniref:hypothetical protein n=1 Tax=Pseudoduganella sp. R-34 TaxID=3404062 RepID=UPI003CE8FC35